MKSLDAPDFIEASWKAHVLIGALADKYAASGLTRIKQFDAVLLRSDGAEQPIGSGLGNVVGGQIFLEITHDLRDEIIENAENAGLTDVHVRTLRHPRSATDFRHGIQPERRYHSASTATTRADEHPWSSGR